MKIAFLISMFVFLVSAAFAQEDSIKTREMRFYQPDTKTEAPAEVVVKDEPVKKSDDIILKSTVEKKKVARKKVPARKD